jgi:iron complex outermembrane recepter protein
LQVLERLPGVISDRRNSQFTLNGQSGITILFNGRKVQLSMEEVMILLESTLADQVDKIELITTPNAEHDADGAAGIINVIFKNNKLKSTNISLSSTLGYGYKEKSINSISIAKALDKVSYNASYSFQHLVGRSGFEGFGSNDETLFGKKTSTIFSGFTKSFSDNHNFNLAAEYRFTPKLTFGGDLIYSLANIKNLVENEVSWDFDNGEYLKFDALVEGKNKRKNTILSTYIKMTFSERSNLNIDLNYINYSNDNPNIMISEYFNRQGDKFDPANAIFTEGNKGNSLSNIYSGVLKVDYNNQLSKNLNTSFGVKMSQTYNANDSNVELKIDNTWKIDPRSQSNIESRENVAAAYSQFKYSFNEKSNLQLGIRYEYWKRDFNIYENKFKIAQFFPSIFYTKTINPSTNFNLSYNRRISRPAYADLVSNLFYNDPTFIFSGNPLLKPALVNALKANFNFKSLSLGLSLQHELDPILRYQITSNKNKDIGILSPQNIDFQKSINLFINQVLEVSKKWKLSMGSTSSLRNYRVSYSLKPAEKTFIFQNFNFNNNIQLPKNYEIELSGWYNLPFYEGTNKLKGFGIVNLGLSKKLNGNQGTFNLSFPDLFRSFSVTTHIGGMTPIAFNINTMSTWKDESSLYRVVRLTFFRNFGGGTQSSKYNTDAEEVERIK